MSLEFLAAEAGAGVLARSPMERLAEAAGARMEERDGWRVAAAFGDVEPARLSDTVGFADVSQLGKFELNAEHDLQPGLADRREGAWWCPLTRRRALVICDPAATAELRERLGPRAIDVTSSYAALTIAGPLSRELFARFCALDLRPASAPPRAFRPGSVARTPGYVLREDGDRFLMLFGWALGEYMWETVADAAGALGGGPVGVDALAPRSEEAVRA
jgi:glycine cleavage system aminomethyltransferase T